MIKVKLLFEAFLAVFLSISLYLWNHVTSSYLLNGLLTNCFADFFLIFIWSFPCDQRPLLFPLAFLLAHKIYETRTR